jgi:hypothetical protein
MVYYGTWMRVALEKMSNVRNLSRPHEQTLVYVIDPIFDMG